MSGTTVEKPLVLREIEADGRPVTVQQFAKRYAVAEQTVLVWLTRGLRDGGRVYRLEAIKAGKNWRMSEGSIARFFNAIEADRQARMSDAAA